METAVVHRRATVLSVVDLNSRADFFRAKCTNSFIAATRTFAAMPARPALHCALLYSSLAKLYFGTAVLPPALCPDAFSFFLDY